MLAGANCPDERGQFCGVRLAKVSVKAGAEEKQALIHLGLNSLGLRLENTSRIWMRAAMAFIPFSENSDRHTHSLFHRLLCITAGIIQERRAALIVEWGNQRL